jgi:hypothetical protein
VEADVLELLAGKNPKQAQDFVLSWGEGRNAAWADAHSQARARAASDTHLRQLRGQLRYQFGEAALSKAANVAGAGCLPIPTVQPGAAFMGARIGRFVLLSATVRSREFMPRPSATRTLLSRVNDDLNPQGKLDYGVSTSSRGATELAYLGFMAVTPSFRDPTIPAELVLAVSNKDITEWLHWIPLHRLYALLQDRIRADNGSAKQRPIKDRRIPTFRVPKPGRGTGDDKSGA